MRFTIRDLLWLAVVVGLSLCWWQERAGHKSDLVRLQDLQETETHLRAILEENGFWFMRSGGRWLITREEPEKSGPWLNSLPAPSQSALASPRE